MKKEDKYLESGDYSVEITLRITAEVLREDCTTEDELLGECRSLGEMVDWEVKK
jgi:hypothetical protein